MTQFENFQIDMKCFNKKLTACVCEKPKATTWNMRNSKGKLCLPFGNFARCRITNRFAHDAVWGLRQSLMLLLFADRRKAVRLRVAFNICFNSGKPKIEQKITSMSLTTAIKTFLRHYLVEATGCLACFNFIVWLSESCLTGGFSFVASESSGNDLDCSFP